MIYHCECNFVIITLYSVNTGNTATEGSHDTVATSDDIVDRILENTQSDLLEFLTDLLPVNVDDNDND